jgi:hypothetical protein
MRVVKSSRTRQARATSVSEGLIGRLWLSQAAHKGIGRRAEPVKSGKAFIALANVRCDGVQVCGGYSTMQEGK